MSGFDDLFGVGSFNTNSNYDDIFSTPTVEQGGYDSNFNYGADPEGITQGGSAVGTTGGFTSTGGGAGSAIADLIKKYGLPALLAGLSAKDRQKATGGGYGRAYQSPAPLTRTMSQGKYGPIAKYAADGGIIQGYKGGDSVRSSFGQLDQTPNPGALAREIQYDPIRNAKAVEAFARFLNPLGMSINDVAQQIKAGNTEGIFKDIAKSMIPFYKTGEKLSEGDMSGAAASLVPSGIKAIYNLITSPEAGRNVTSQVPNEITSTLADYNPEDLRTAVMATIPEFDTAQANTSLSRGFTPSVAQPSGMQDFGTFEDMARGAQAQKEQQANNGEVVSFGVPDQNTEQFVDQYSLAQPEAQGTDFGAMNDPGYDGMGGVSDTDPTRGPSVYGNYDSGVGSNFNNPSGPGEGGFGAGSYDNSNLSESGFGSGTGFGGGGGGGINRDDYILAPYAQGGGIAAMAKGRFLRGPGDGVSDSIPATIDGNQPAALADGEFVIPARVVSELGNGSSEAGARKLHAMMVRIQKDRRGAKNIAANTKVDRHLPA